MLVEELLGLALELKMEPSKKIIDACRGPVHEKLSMGGRAELVRYAVAAGLFGMPSGGR